MRIDQRFKLRTVAGEHMIMDMRGSSVNMTKVFSLNEPAAWLWRKIGGDSFDEPMLVEWLCNEYEVSAEVAKADVSSMVGLWRKFDMVYDDK